jgi:ribosomal protein S18 acetylase RimI-like enzyme
MDLRKVTAKDVPAVVEVLARAFDDDPWVTWLARKGPRRGAAIRELFRISLAKLALQHDESWTTPDVQGAALWIPPGKWQVRAWDQIRMLPAAVRISGARRLLEIGRSTAGIAKAHPAEAHYYLLQLGVDPPAQGKGLGRRLMAPVLERCERERVAAYLETARESNLRFYRRDGFEIASEHPIPGGPVVWGMWRPKPA